MTQVTATSTKPASTISSSSLYVGDLKPEVSESDLWTLFAAYGQINGVRICRDSTTQCSLGYGYVNFRTAAEAESAIKGLNLTQIAGKPCRIMFCNRDPSRRKNGAGNLYLKNIDDSLSSRDLYDAFSVFGSIMSCKLALDENGRSRGFGFIQFYSESDADTAIQKANGVEFKKKTIVITKFLPRSQRNQSGDKPIRFTNIFIKNFKDQWTVEDLKKNFSQFGEITSYFIKEDSDKKPLGFGFVNYAKPECASEAVNKMNGFVLPSGLTLFVDRAQKKSERAAILLSQQEKRRLEFHREYVKRNLYVKNFDSFTDETLKAEFAVFGEIKSARVMKDETGKSKGFGFVCFVNVESAEKAFSAMAGKMYDSKPLYVSYAQNREERRRMLSQRTFIAPIGRPNIPMMPYAPYMYPGVPSYVPQMRFPQQYMNMGSRPISRMPQSANLMNSGYSNMREHYQPALPSNLYQQHGPRSRAANLQQSRPYTNLGPRGHYAQPPNFRLRAQQLEAPVVAAANHISTEIVQPTSPKVKKEEVESGPKGNKTVLSDEDWGNYIFSIARKCLSTEKLDTALIQKITGVVLKKYKQSSSNSSLPAEDDVRKYLTEAYKQITSKLAPIPVSAN